MHNVSGINEDLAIEFAGTWPEYLHDDVQSLLQCGELMAVLAYLAKGRGATSRASSSWALSYAPLVRASEQEPLQENAVLVEVLDGEGMVWAWALKQLLEVARGALHWLLAPCMVSIGH